MMGACCYTFLRIHAMYNTKSEPERKLRTSRDCDIDSSLGKKVPFGWLMLLMEKTLGAGGVWEISVLPLHFAVQLKVLWKIKSLKKVPCLHSFSLPKATKILYVHYIKKHAYSVSPILFKANTSIENPNHFTYVSKFFHLKYILEMIPYEFIKCFLLLSFSG